ncbi:MAG TPA: hypothetical protein VGB73_15960 [Pyrinomonadaceae bacterium]|jgi:hypothetical protein
MSCQAQPRRKTHEGLYAGQKVKLKNGIQFSLLLDAGNPTPRYFYQTIRDIFISVLDCCLYSSLRAKENAEGISSGIASFISSHRPAPKLTKKD